MKKKGVIIAILALIVFTVICITIKTWEGSHKQVIFTKDTEALSRWECDEAKWWQKKGRCMDRNDGDGKVCIEIFDFDFWPGNCTTQFYTE